VRASCTGSVGATLGRAWIQRGEDGTAEQPDCQHRRLLRTCRERQHCRRVDSWTSLLTYAGVAVKIAIRAEPEVCHHDCLEAGLCREPADLTSLTCSWRNFDLACQAPLRFISPITSSVLVTSVTKTSALFAWSGPLKLFLQCLY
jgi:hypothetical protein